jgi:DNA-binding NarL/FixJ family response regulator
MDILFTEAKPEEKKIKVFIVDDSATIRDRLVTMLDELTQVKVIGQAKDVSEAIKAIQKSKPDVVIIDIRMPGGSGLDVLKNIHREQPDTKIIMLTNYPFAAYRKKCLEAGANFFFDKSTEIDKIPQAFEQIAAQA